jgi:hypothetical protein
MGFGGLVIASDLAVQPGGQGAQLSIALFYRRGVGCRDIVSSQRPISRPWMVRPRSYLHYSEQNQAYPGSNHLVMNPSQVSQEIYATTPSDGPSHRDLNRKI